MSSRSSVQDTTHMDLQDRIRYHLQKLRVRATTPPNVIRNYQWLVIVAVGILHASIVGVGLIALGYPVPTAQAESLIMFSGLTAVGIAVAMFLWMVGSVSPMTIVGILLIGSLIGDLIAPPSAATLDGQTLVVGVSTLSVYAQMWPIVLVVGSLLGLSERLLTTKAIPPKWSVPIARYRALVLSGFIGLLHVVVVFALIEYSLSELSVGLVQVIGMGLFATGVVATYALVHWRYFLAPGFAVIALFVTGVYAAWPTPGDAALGYGYVQVGIIVGLFLFIGIERGWRAVRHRNTTDSP